MLINPAALKDALDHGEREYPREACGVFATSGDREYYVPCRNVRPGGQFEINADDYTAAEDSGDIIAIFHTHVDRAPTPTQADLVSCEFTKLPWVIGNSKTRQHTVTTPSGYVAPLVGRSFVFGVLDCYALIRDYYKQVLGIDLPDFERKDRFWERGENLYHEHSIKAGFYEVRPNDEWSNLKKHDVILMRVGSRRIDNHGAVYVGDNKILHHLQNRLSCHDVWGGHWRQMATTIMRRDL